MRISKLARNYDISIQEVTEFLETLNIPNQSLHPNAKLGENLIQDIIEHFGLTPILDEEAIQAEPELEEPEVQPLEDEDPQLEDTDAEMESDLPEVPAPHETVESASEPLKVEEVTQQAENFEAEEIATLPPKEDEIILSDQLLEMLDAEEVPAELEKIKLIKAPKKELSGLKVVGKIEVPEDPRKKSRELKEAEKREALARKPKLSDEEREERRLRAKRKKEEYEARKERKERQQIERKEKLRKTQHYKNNLVQKKSTASEAVIKQKKKSYKKVNHEQDVNSKRRPRTILGRFWRWLNSSGYD